jgi:hypothetical protein
MLTPSELAQLRRVRRAVNASLRKAYPTLPILEGDSQPDPH